MRWWMLALVLLGCPGPSDSTDGGADAGIDAEAFDAATSGQVHVSTETRLEGVATDALADDEHRVSVIRVEVDALEWRSDASEGIRVEIGQSIDFFGESRVSLQLPPGRYSAVEVHIGQLEMVVDDAVVMETEEFHTTTRCDSVLDLRVGSERAVSLTIEGETLLDELATRLEEDPASEAIRESFKEAIEIDCD